jgi:hypothetical protein
MLVRINNNWKASIANGEILVGAKRTNIAITRVYMHIF